MKLLRHLLAHQWSSLKLAHFGWLVLLAVHFLLRFTQGFEDVLPVRQWDFPMHPESLTMVLWGMATIILLAQEDAIANPTAFWITKPPSFASLWLAKGIIIFALYLLLPLLVEMLIWWKLDFGSWIPRMVVQWSITQLSWILPSMVVGMLARTFPQSLLWFGALVAGVAISTFIASLCGIQPLTNPHGQTPGAAQTLVFYQIIWQTLLAAICLVVFLITKRHSFGKVITLASLIAFGFIKTRGTSPEMDRWLSMRDNANLAKEGTFAVLGASYGGSSSSGGIITSKRVSFTLGWLGGIERPDWVRLIPKISTPTTKNHHFYPTGPSEGHLIYQPSSDFDPQTLNSNPVIPFRIEMGQTLEIFRHELPVKTGASWVDGPTRAEIRSVKHVPGDVLVEIYTRVPFFAYPDWNLETAAPYLIHLPTQQHWRLYREKALEHGQPARYLWETNVTYSVEGWGLSGDTSSPPDKIAAKTYLKEDSPWLSECKLVWVAETEAPWKPQDASFETSRILATFAKESYSSEPNLPTATSSTEEVWYYLNYAKLAAAKEHGWRSKEAGAEFRRLVAKMPNECLASVLRCGRWFQPNSPENPTFDAIIALAEEKDRASIIDYHLNQLSVIQALIEKGWVEDVYETMVERAQGYGLVPLEWISLFAQRKDTRCLTQMKRAFEINNFYLSPRLRDAIFEVPGFPVNDIILASLARNSDKDSTFLAYWAALAVKWGNPQAIQMSLGLLKDKNSPAAAANQKTISDTWGSYSSAPKDPSALLIWLEGNGSLLTYDPATHAWVLKAK